MPTIETVIERFGSLCVCHAMSRTGASEIWDFVKKNAEVIAANKERLSSYKTMQRRMHAAVGVPITIDTKHQNMALGEFNRQGLWCPHIDDDDVYIFM